MKTKLYIAFYFSLCLNGVFSQTLYDLEQDIITIETKEKPYIEFIYKVDREVKPLSILVTGNDMFTVQVFNYAINDVSLGINNRFEEELPYKDMSYDYKGFYYLDFNLSYDIGKFNIGFSIENLLNLNSQDFSIDPNLETSNGISNAYYLSHESDALALVTLTYNF